MSTFREVLLHAATRMYEDAGITETDMHTAHVDEYAGDTYTTPSLIDHDDGKENDPIGLVQG